MGLFSRTKKSQGNMHMRGFPGHVDTCKCLYLAAEKGVPIDTDLLDMTGQEHEKGAYLALSPFGKIPCLGDNSLVISGAAAILPYLDIKGGGKSLTPRKAAHLGEQNYWIEVGENEVQPHINVLLEEQVLNSMTDPDYTSEQNRVDAAINEISRAFDVADRHLEGKDYFTNDFSFAEIHWVPYLHFCEITGHGDLLDKRPQLKRWFGQLKSRKNGARVIYDVLPNLEHIKGKELKYAA